MTNGEDVQLPGAGNYAEVYGLNMYYEIHGTGEPLVLLHGAYMTIEAMGEVVLEFAKTRQVIAVELQGHGRTADIDRSLSCEQRADDAAALLRHLEIEDADIFGYSMGAALPCRSPLGIRMSCASWWSLRPPTPVAASTPRSSR
jgi:alpha-beta hydrolase superfamily lysophospholipase